MTTPATPSDGPPARQPALRAAAPMTLRSADDVLAAVRVVLGFEPHDSLVLIAVGGQYPLQARVDLPEDLSHADFEQNLDELADQLLEPVSRLDARCVLLVAYTEHERLGRRSLRGLVRRLTVAGTSVADAMRADGRRWYPLDHDRSSLTVTGVPYDVDAHPFVVAAVVEGRVVHGCRDDLAATMRADPDLVAEVEAARSQPPVSARWVRVQAARHAGSGTTPSAGDAARLLEGIAVTDVREAVWTRADRAMAPAAVEFWTDLVRRAPDDLVADAAAVLAFQSWLSGDGARAWCAVDRALAADPDQGLARLVGDLLEAAFPPQEWESTRDALGFAS